MLNEYDALKTALTEGLQALSLNTAPADGLLTYLDALLTKNEVMNLTAIREPSAAVRLHLLDACALASPVSALPGQPAYDFAGKTVIDVGTGGGVPGMPLAILCPAAQVTLLDSAEKKIAFLRETAEAMRLANVHPISGRAEEIGLRECFDCAVSRAVARMNILCELTLPFIRVGGVFLAMKSTLSDEELAEAGRAIRVLGGVLEGVADYAVPGLFDEAGAPVVHRVIHIRKTAPTPKGYPRRFAKIKQKPLV